jgi:hypothetical protein
MRRGQWPLSVGIYVGCTEVENPEELADGHILEVTEPRIAPMHEEVGITSYQAISVASQSRRQNWDVVGIASL